MAVFGLLAWQGRLGGPVASGLILGGATANLADRALGGSVIDIIDLGWWPAFNMADVFIVGGILLLALPSATRLRPTEDRAADAGSSLWSP